MSWNRDGRVPLTVIGGFLGAGKTTFLNALIREGIPNDSLIVVNDFGEINIDAELIDYRDDRMVQLSNGCICCTLGGSLAERLAQAMRLHDGPEAIFIETSGVADPARIADIARVSGRLELKEVVCLVDGGRARRHGADPLIGETWRAQIRAASRILVNRLPACGSERDWLTRELRRLNPAALIDLGKGVEPPAAGEPGQGAATEGAAMEGAATERITRCVPVSDGGWASASPPMPDPVDAAVLQRLLLEHGDVLVRAKGFLRRRDREALQLLQFSGGRIVWTPAARSQARCQLVCIGRAGERFDALVAALRGGDLSRAPGRA